MKYNKLVRDKIPAIIKTKGQKCTTHTATKQEFFEKLCDKLIEEAYEFKENPTLEEFADVVEVVNALGSHRFKRENVEYVRKMKGKEKGTFKTKTILEEAG